MHMAVGSVDEMSSGNEQDTSDKQMIVFIAIGYHTFLKSIPMKVRSIHAGAKCGPVVSLSGHT